MADNMQSVHENVDALSSNPLSHSIKTTLTRIIFLVSLVSLFLGGLVISLEDKREFEKEFADKMVLITKTVGSYAAADITFKDVDAAIDSLSKLRQIPSVINAYLYDPEGELFVSLNQNNLDNKLATKTNDIILTISNETLSIVSPVYFENVHYGYISLIASTAEINERLNQRLQIMGFLAIFLLIVAYLLARWMQSKVTRPILNLAATAINITNKGDYNLRVDKSSNDEIGALYDSFNQLLTKISEEKKLTSETLRELRASEARFSAMYNSIPDAVMFADTSRRIRMNNPAVLNMFQYSDDELIGNTTEMLYPTQEAFIEQGKVRFNQDAKDKDLPYEVQYKRKDGSVFWTESLGAKVVTRDNTHIGFVGIFRDISQRKQHEELLARQQHEQGLILDTMIESVIAIDENGKIGSFNRSAEKMFGYKVEEVLGENIKILMPEKLAEKHDDLLRSTRQTGKMKVIGIGREVLGKRKSGEEFPIRISIAELPLNQSGLKRYIGTIQDVTSEKLQQEILQRSQKMEALGKLTGGIAHDFNNTLNIIMGYSQLIETLMSEDSKTKSYIKEILNASERARTLTTKLLSFSRNRPIAAKNININQVLSETQLMLEKSLTARIKLNLSLANNLWPAYLEAAGLVDLILNLSINALHAMPDGGALSIETKNITLNEFDSAILQLEPSEYVALCVADTGIGMSPEVKNRIFEPFFTTKGEQGNGLGLTQVYNYVQQFKGGIQVFSKQNYGTQFIIYFPRSAETENVIEIQKKINLTDRGNGQVVLVVDDEVALTKLAEEILVGNGYKVIAASNGQSALEILDRETVNILFSDVVMPGMNGYELAEKVIKRNPAVKVQLTSGYHDVSQIPSLNLELYDKLLSKPYSAKDLLESISSLNTAVPAHHSAESFEILVLDDDKDVQLLMGHCLGKLGHSVLFANNGEQAINLYSDAIANRKPIDAVIVDINLVGKLNGIDTASKILEIDPNANLIVSSGDSYGSVMQNYQQYGFKAALEKVFNKEEISKILTQILGEKIVR